MSSGSVYLSHARYGKQAVRVFRVVKEDKWHTVVEYNVTVLLEGDIDVSYTKADNSVVVATDSMKNITYHLAKTSPHVLHPERFALHLGTYMVSKYSHIHKSFVTVEQLRWKRIDVNGQEHSHSFWRDGDEKRFASVEVDATKGKDKIVATVSAGISDLLVLKSTGSAFENFVRDEHTTLAEVNDRIFSTSIDLKYTYAPFSVPTNAVVDSFKLADDVSSEGTAWDGDAVAAKAKTATLEVFAVDESASVQASLYKMAERILSENKHVQTVSYSLPNKHYIPVDMRYAGIDNLTPCVSLLLLHCFLFCFFIFTPLHAIARFDSVLRISSAAFLRFVRCSFTAQVLRYPQSSIICYYRRTTDLPLFLHCGVLPRLLLHYTSFGSVGEPTSLHHYTFDLIGGLGGVQGYYAYVSRSCLVTEVR